ncbi:hypothetical protein [Streptomyces sp. NPDC060065]|uniref:hypothetical protein n=1 Tax=Streptomyces sp. NPDC060065 TaxID=3347050 RepID=UPI003689F684
MVGGAWAGKTSLTAEIVPALVREDLTDPDDFASGLALLDAAFVVVLCARVDPQASEHDAMERGIGLPVTTTVEATVLPVSRGVNGDIPPWTPFMGGPS